MCLVPSFPTNTLAVSPNSTNVALPDPTVTVNGSNNVADIQITAFGGTVSLDTTGVTVTAGDGTDDQAITINGDNSAVQAALATLTFTPTNGLVGENEAHVQLSSTGAANSRLEIILTNAPFITLPSAPSVTEDASNVAFGSAINIDDATGDTQTVTLTVTGGTFSIGNGAGLSYSVGNGFANTTATFSGSVTDVNNALDTLFFTPTPNLNGTGVASLRVQSDDGNGGTDDETLTFNITAVNDDPTVTGLPSDVSFMEDVAGNLDLSAVTLSDVDAGSGSVTLTLAASEGTLTASDGGNVTVGGSTTTALTLTGSIADIDAFLNTASNVQYQGSSNDNGDNTATLTLTINDGGNTGTGGGTDVSLGTINIDITAANDAPVITLPSAPSVAEDASNIPFTSALNIDDIEGDTQTVTLTVTGGTLSIGNSAGLTYSVGNGFSNTTTTFSGALTDVNNALDTLVFTPTPNLNGTGIASLRVQTSDGNGGTDDETLTFDVTPVNDAPTGTDSTKTTTEDTSLTFSASDFGFGDVDTGDSFASVRIDVLPSSSTGELQLSGSTVTAGQVIAVADIPNLTFVPVANLNGAGAASFSFSVNDGSAFDGAPNTITIDITAANDAPVITLPSAPSVGEDASNIPFTSALNIDDVEGDAQTVTLTVTGGTFSIGNGDGLSYSVGNGFANTTATFSGSVTDVNNALDTLFFTPTPNLNGTGVASLRVQSDDGNGGTDDETLTFDVAAVNDDPTATGLPTDVSFTEDTAGNLDLSGITLSDVDAGTGDVTLTLTASEGTMTANNGSGVTVAGSTTATLTLTGTVANIDAFLNTASNIQYQGSSNDNGDNTATLTVTINDGGNTGSGGGTDITLGTINIDITAANDAPTSSNNTVTMNEDTSRTFTVADFPFSDVDTGDNLQSVRIDTLTLNSGTLRLSGIDVTANQVISVADIAAGNLVYIPAANANGNGLLTFTYSVGDGTDFATSPSTFTVNVTDIAEPAPPTPVVTSVNNDNTDGGQQSGSSQNDSLGGSGGNDTLSGGNGGDTLIGGAGDDFVAGGNGNDTSFAGPGDTGDDTVQGNAGNDLIGGGAGDDIIVGGNFSSNASASNSGNSGDDTLFGGAGNDLIVAGSYNSATMTVVNTGQGNNTAWAGTGDDTVFGDDNQDILGGGSGGDSLNGGSGDDTIFGGSGDDTVEAGDDNDTTFSGAGNDSLDGGNGDDTLFGGAGDDTVAGGAGADEIWAGAGDDDLSGGAGADTFVFGRNSGNDTVSDFNTSEDTIDLRFAATEFTSLADVTAAASETTQGGQSGVSIDLGDSQSVFIQGIGLDDLSDSNVSF